MNRTQKKCLIASVATHGLLLVLLFVGPAFLASSDDPQPHKFITMIPLGTQITDEPTSISGSAPQQVSQPPPQPQVQPQPPQPLPIPAPPTPADQPQVVTPSPQPAPQPVAEPLPKTRDEFKPVKPKVAEPNEFKPVKGPTAKSPAKEKSKDSTDTLAADAQRAAAARLQKQIGALANTLSKDDLVQIGTSGDSGAANANYNDLVYSIYTAAWHPPASLTDDAATVTVRVTISRSGQVTHHQITTPSGNGSMDKSIEITLDNVTSVAPFPDGSKDLERSFVIKFNISAKKSM